MKILQLTAENVKRLKVVDITPKDALVQVTGKNGSGKTSVLDSIWWALGGKDGIQSVPIRRGAEEARIRLDLGELIVERKFTASGTTSLTVRNPAGVDAKAPDKKRPKFEAPQEMLDALLGELTFDPLAFARMKPREQFEELRRISGLAVDVDELRRLNDADFAKRTDKNRRAKELRAQALGFAFEHPATASKVDVGLLVQSLEQATQQNADIDKRIERRAEAAGALDKLRIGLDELEKAREGKVKSIQDDLEAEITRLRRIAEAKTALVDSEIMDRNGQIAALEEKLAGAAELPAKTDTAVLREGIAEAQILNREFDRRAEQAGIIKQAEAIETDAETLTKAMAARERTKLDALLEAKMPIEGLALADGIVTYNGIPFEQASDAEKLRVSAAITMASNAKLRVIRIRDGSLLDDDGIAMLAEMAAERDYQVWLERVDSTGKIGIVREDGEVKPAEAAQETT